MIGVERSFMSISTLLPAKPQFPYQYNGHYNIADPRDLFIPQMVLSTDAVHSALPGSEDLTKSKVE